MYCRSAPSTYTVEMLTSFGVASVSLMLISYALEERAPMFVLMFRRCVRGIVRLRISRRRVAFWDR